MDLTQVHNDLHINQQKLNRENSDGRSFCRSLSNLEILRIENNSLENGPLLQCSGSSTSPKAMSPESDEERQGNTINSAASTSESPLQSLEVRLTPTLSNSFPKLSKGILHNFRSYLLLGVGSIRDKTGCLLPAGVADGWEQHH
jgi:hypothetical protein